MIDPVSSGIRGERKMADGFLVDFVIKFKKDTEAGECKNRMCGSGESVVV